jgi:uncharacterized membrane protein
MLTFLLILTVFNFFFCLMNFIIIVGLATRINQIDKDQKQINKVQQHYFEQKYN